MSEEKKRNTIDLSTVNLVWFACEAGAGSSLMGARSLSKKFKKAKLNVEVKHSPARAVPEDAQLVLVHQGMMQQIASRVPGAVIIPYKMFLNDPIFDKLVKAFVDGKTIVSRA